MEIRILMVVITVILVIASGCQEQRSGDEKVRFYSMDCGSFDVSDMSTFSEKGEFDGKKTTLVNPCFLIRHPKGDLLWDTGLEEKLADMPDGIKDGVWHSRLDTMLSEHLAQLGIKPPDIEYLSLSHIHPDHSGNANLFSSSKFIINELERQYMFSDKIKAMFGKSYSELEDAKTLIFKDEHDVFGDETVIIKSMPGHTPGSSVLLIRLENSGNILLTGDLYIHSKGRELQTLLIYNTDKQATIESREKFEALARKENARVIIQHEKQDFNSLPQFPEFLD